VKTGKLQINDLRIKAPGLTTEQARRLGQMVAQRLVSTQFNKQTSRTVPTARVQLNRAGTSLETMANEVVEGIRRKLR
jgi:hypothetical protein